MAASPSIEASAVSVPAPGLAGNRGSLWLDRPSTAQRVADALRERMWCGELQAGAQVGELQLTVALGVSRNTLREAFQILIGERLLTREPHRGVFVRRLTADDVRDVYAFRRLVECAAVGHPAQPRGLVEMRTALKEGQTAARRKAWHDVGTADVRFHMGVAALGGSARLDRVMRALFAELRLAFQLVPDPRALHEPFLSLNAEIYALAEQGDSSRASLRLRAYLDEAEAVIVAAVEGG
jgi:DNA-binding GntR family transcriptional regulator